MPNATVDLAIPYALDTDARAAWPGTSQDLAERVRDLMLTPSNAQGSGAAASLPHNVAVGMAYPSTAVSPDWAYSVHASGTGLFTYSGPRRAFMVVASAHLAGGSGTLDELELLLQLDGANVAKARSTGVLANTLTASMPFFINPGSYLGVTLFNANAAASTGSAADGYLHVVAL